MAKAIRIYRKPLLLAVLVAGIACLAVAAFGLADYWRTTGKDEAMPGTEIVSRTVNPSEKNPGKVSDEYVVPADQPRVISIPSLDVEAYIQRVGIDQNNVMVAPNNIFYAGWYVGSVAPGEKGVSIIDGHAGGRYENGVFRRLVSLKNGDAVRVQMGDRTWREFVVESTGIHSVEESSMVLFADDPNIERELHLITCDGVFDDRTQTYDKRLIAKLSLSE